MHYTFTYTCTTASIPTADYKEGGGHPRGHTLNLCHAGLKLGSATWIPECVMVVVAISDSAATSAGVLNAAETIRHAHRHKSAGVLNAGRTISHVRIYQSASVLRAGRTVRDVRMRSNERLTEWKWIRK